jgi:hypothetical protein
LRVAVLTTATDLSNASTLDLLDSTQFLRSDAADTKTSGDLSFSDNVKAQFGTGNDLQIYHDGSNSYISEQGTGSLKLLTSFFTVKNSLDTKQFLNATNNGAVKLFYDDNLKIETTATGVEVTGLVALL